MCVSVLLSGVACSMKEYCGYGKDFGKMLNDGEWWNICQFFMLTLINTECFKWNKNVNEKLQQTSNRNHKPTILWCYRNKQWTSMNAWTKAKVVTNFKIFTENVSSLITTNLNSNFSKCIHKWREKWPSPKGWKCVLC